MDKFFTVEEREQLYNEIWAEPVSIVAKRYGISDAALRKRCKKMNIPLPPRGYWEKIKSGQKIEKPALSKVFGRYVGSVHKSVINYKYNVSELSDEELLAEEELSLLTDETKELIKKKCNSIVVKNQLRNAHQLILNHQEEIKLRKQKEKEFRGNSFLYSRYSNKEIIYKNYKSTLPIHVSDRNIKRVYRILDALFKTVEELDGSVSIEPYIGKDVANIRIGRHFYGFEVKEEFKKKSKKNKNNKDTEEEMGALVIQFSIRSSYGKSLTDNLTYTDSEDELLETQLPKILYNLFVISNKLDVLEEISTREFYRKSEEEKRQQHLEEMRKAELEKFSQLENLISDWDKAQKIREFADTLEKNMTALVGQDDIERFLLYVNWIRDKADWIDPTISKEDEVFGKKHDFNKILKGFES